MFSLIEYWPWAIRFKENDNTKVLQTNIYKRIYEVLVNEASKKKAKKPKKATKKSR